MNAAILLQLAEHLETCLPGNTFIVGRYENTLQGLDVSEEKFLDLLSIHRCSRRSEVAARIRKFVEWKQEVDK